MPHLLPEILIATALALAVLFALGRYILAINPRPGDPDAAALVRFFQLYARALHNLRVHNAHNIPDHLKRKHANPTPLIIAVNHTAGIDPILVHAAIPNANIRWMMAADMRSPALEGLWNYANIIFVDRDDPKPDAIKQAIKHLNNGGTLGIFPEARIERPPKQLLPFKQGLGTIVRRTNAPVLPVVVRDTPLGPTAWHSITRPSNATVEILPLITYDTKALKPADITTDLQKRFQQATGWPINSKPEPMHTNPHPNDTDPTNPTTAPLS